MRSAYKILAQKPEGRTLWENNTKTDPEVIGCESAADWIQVAQVRTNLRALVNTGIKLRVPYKTGNVFIG
jgi:hypothetical protein